MSAAARRWLYAIAALSAAPAVFVLVAWLCSTSIKDINACRLAQIVGIVYHQPLYPDPVHGVMSPWTSGPVPALLFLVAAPFSHPTTQLLVAAGFNACIIFGSTLWFCLRFSGKEDRAIGCLAFLVVLWCILTHDSLAQMTFGVSADGPMVGFTLCAVSLLLGSRGKISLTLAAIAMVLAAWCNASVFPLLAIVPVYLAVNDRKSAAWYGVMLAIAFVLISGIIVAAFGAANTWHFMVSLPFNQPWLNDKLNVITEGRPAAVGESIVMLLHDVIPTIALFIAIVLLRKFLFDPSHRQSFFERAWSMFPLMALLLVPASVLAYLKMGRHSESIGAAHFFLVMTVAAALIQLYRSCPDYSYKGILVACVCVYSGWQATSVVMDWRHMTSLYQAIQNTYANPHETAYAFTLEHPGEVFFPANTLSTLQAEQRLYHSEAGFNLYYRAHPNEPFDADRIHQFTPAQIRFIAFPQQHESENIRKVFELATQRANIAQLPGFVAYTQPARQ